MKLTTRITKLFTADAHAVLDSMEEPLSQLKQALRDMEQVINAEKASLDKLAIHKKQLAHQLQILTDQYEAAEKDLDVCFESENEILARSIVKKKLYLGQRIEQVKQNQHQSDEKQQRLEQALLTNQEQYQLIEQQAAVYLAKQEETAGDSVNPAEQFNVIGEDEIEMAFLNEKRKRVNS